MAKRSGLADLIGRTIIGVTVKESDRPPHMQLFLTLDDGRYYEIWSQDSGMGFCSMTYGGGLDAVEAEGRRDAETVFEVVADDDGTPKQTVLTKDRDDIEGRKSQRRPLS